MSDLRKSQSPVECEASDSEGLMTDDDNQFPYHEFCRDHAPATSHGTYLAGPGEGVENLEDYQIGGYHPIYLGVRLGDSGRYHILHKLGYGGFSTVGFAATSRKANTSLLRSLQQMYLRITY